MWRKGKEHAIPDALSRSPVANPTSDDEASAGDLISSAHQHLIRRIRAISGGTGETDGDIDDTPMMDHLRDLTLEEIRETAAADAEYADLITAIESGFPKSRKCTPSHIRQFWNIRQNLSVDQGIILFGCRILIPRAARRSILQKLHAAHQGIIRTKRRA